MQCYKIKEYVQFACETGKDPVPRFLMLHSGIIKLTIPPHIYIWVIMTRANNYNDNNDC